MQVDTPGLPEPRIVRLHIDGTLQHFYTWSDAPLLELTLADLKPHPVMDACAFLERVVQDHTIKKER